MALPGPSSPGPRPAEGRPRRLLAWVLLLVALPATLLGAGLGALTLGLLSQQLRAPVVEGRIVAEDRREGGTVAPVIRFETPDGSSHQVVGNIATGDPSWRVGEAMGVRYDPADPAQGTPDTFWSFWLAPLLLGIPALLLLAPGLATAFFALRLLGRGRQAAPDGSPDGSPDAAPDVAPAATRPGGDPADGAPPSVAIPATAGAGFAAAAAALAGRAAAARAAGDLGGDGETAWRVSSPSPVPPDRRALRRAMRPGVVLLLAAAGFAVLAGVALHFDRAFRARSVLAEGEVVAIERVGRKGESYAPVFRFRTAANEEVRVRQGWSSGIVAWSVGERTAMRYDPENPRDAAPDRFFAQWGDAVAWGGAALLCALAGAAVIARARRRGRRWSRLWQEGRPVRAELLEVVAEGPSGPWRVRARHDDPRRHRFLGLETLPRRYLYTSLPLAEDPAPLLRGRDWVTVQVHPDDPAVHAMIRPGGEGDAP